MEANSRRTRRRVGVWLGAALVTVALVGLAASALVKQAYVDEYRGSGTELLVQYVPAGSCDSVLSARVQEDAERVVVDIRSMDGPPGFSRNAMAYLCQVTFTLREPLGDREVWRAGAEVSVDEEWARAGRAVTP